MEDGIKLIHALHDISTLKGNQHRLLTECVYHLETALAAHRKGRAVVVEQRLEVVLEQLRANLKELEQ